MVKAASKGRLSELHGMIAESMIERLLKDKEDDLPTDAATLSAMIKFLKDNNISADPAGADDMTLLRQGLKDQLAEQRERRAKAKAEALALADADVKALTG